MAESKSRKAAIKPAKKAAAKKSAPKKTAAKRSAPAFSAEERAAMRELARERKSATGIADVLAKIKEMPEPDRSLAMRIHELVLQAAPDLSPRTWYGMPAYAKDGDVICFFQNASKFKARYGTLGFQDKAKLDDGEMWATSFAITKMTAANEKKIIALVKKAVR